MLPDSPVPCQTPHQTPRMTRWLDHYRELVTARGSVAALTRDDLAVLALELQRQVEELRP